PIEEMQEDQRHQVAIHEAGHAVAQHYLRPDERIVRVSIIRRSEALGYVLPVPNYDIYALPLRVLVADVLVSLAGHVAVKIFLGEYWTGATSDFQSVRSRIWTLASLGYFGPPVADPMMALQRETKNSQVDRFWSQAEESVERLLIQHSHEVEAVTQALLDKGDLNGKDVLEIIARVSGSNGKVSPEELLPRPDSQVTATDQAPLEIS
ncbi:MAG TPA: hypothetical protein VN648_27140, partial [Candidatus Methylomirabilis sp.]|nr:hypothetical protein [Candidatus Methylomirabilis sp.]